MLMQLNPKPFLHNPTGVGAIIDELVAVYRPHATTDGMHNCVASAQIPFFDFRVVQIHCGVSFEDLDDLVAGTSCVNYVHLFTKSFLS